MKQTKLSEISIEEKKHSHKWYQDKIIHIFTELEKVIQNNNTVDDFQYQLIVNDGSSWKINPFPDKKRTERTHTYYMRVPYSFASVFARVYCNQSILNKKEDSRLYESYRVELLKQMNLIDSFCEKICEYNISKTVFANGMDIRSIGSAFVWYMCHANSPEKVDPQDLNRLRAFFRLQIELKLQAQNERRFYNINEIDEEYKEISRIIDGEDAKSQIVICLKQFKNQLEKLIEQTFEIYSILTYYREYLMVLDKENIEADLRAVKYALLLSNTVARIFFERFTAFSKIPNLNLASSKLNSINLSRSNVSNSNFINSNFQLAQMDNAVLSGCDFSICCFNMASARNANFDRCSFNYSDMTGIDLRNISCDSSQFDSVVFRDLKVDNDVKFMKTLNKTLGAETTYDQISILIDKREKILNKYREEIEDGDSTAYIRKKVGEIYHYLGKSSNDKRLWNLTLADSKDDTVHLCLTDDKGSVPDYSKTVFDSVFIEVKKLLDRIDNACAGKVVDQELLDLLITAELKEKESERSSRIAQHGTFSLQKTNLSSATITNSMLHQIDFSHINLSNASFLHSDMSECLVYYSNAVLSSFAGAILGDSVFYSTNLTNVSFSKSNLINSCFIDCEMDSIDMNNAVAIGMCVINMKRSKPFIGEILMPIDGNDMQTNRIFDVTENINDEKEFDEKQIMCDGNLVGIAASKAIFINMWMDRTHFSNADLRATLFFNDVCRWASFDGIDASYALFLGNSYHQSNINRANLSQSHIFACEFSGCQMESVDFIGARCDKIIFFDNDMSESNFSHCLFCNCIFRDCDFNRINLSNVDFVNCVFTNIDFSDCRGIQRAVFTNCSFIGYDENESNEDMDFLGSSFDLSSMNNSIILKEIADDVAVRVSFSKVSNNGKLRLYSTKNK